MEWKSPAWLSELPKQEFSMSPESACFSFPSRNMVRGTPNLGPRFHSQLCCSLAVAVRSHVWSALGSREVIRDGSQGDLATTGEIYSVLESSTVTYTHL